MIVIEEYLVDKAADQMLLLVFVGDICLLELKQEKQDLLGQSQILCKGHLRCK